MPTSTLRLGYLILDIDTDYSSYADSLDFKYENTNDVRFIVKPFEEGGNPEFVINIGDFIITETCLPFCSDTKVEIF